MVKHVILLIVFSIAAVFFRNQLVHVLHFLLYIHNAVTTVLAKIFSNDSMGQVIQGVVALIIIPAIGGGIAALVFWIIKRGGMPHTLVTIWFVWTILLVTLLAQAAGLQTPPVSQ